MSNTVQLSDVQLLNLSVLMTVQGSIKKDLVANRGQESLFKLRDDFWQLLDAPPGLQGPLSTVRKAETRATVAGPRSMPRRESD